MLTAAAESILVVVLLLDFAMLGVSRIRSIVFGVAIQGLLLGILPLLVNSAQGSIGFREVVVSLGAIALKGIVIPRMLTRAMVDVPMRREIEPLIGYRASLVLGALAVFVSMRLAQVLPLDQSPLPSARAIVTTSFATVLTGFLLIITRIKAITQVVGYLVLENGIFVFGLLLLHAMPFLVEVGVLLDLFVAIFVMGIIIHHISREFSSISTDRLAELKE